MNQNQPKSIFLIAGEASGDLLGSALMRELRGDNLRFSGVGGPLMQKEGLDLVLESDALAVMGFVDILTALPRITRHFIRIRNQILATNPDMVLFIDSPGFNLRMAKSLRKRGYKGKLVHYVAPTIWAHSPERKSTLVETLDLLLVIYPFEKALFADTPLKTVYVGDPLWDTTPAPTDAEKENLIALFPGSRVGEVKRNLPIMRKAMDLIRRTNPSIQFALSVASEELLPLIGKIDATLVPREQSLALMQRARAAIAVSGTVTRELALCMTPTICLYQPGLPTAIYARYFLGLNLPFYCIVNIIAGKEVFPEYIDLSISAKEIASSTLSLYEEGPTRHDCLEECQKLLQNNRPSASKQAAEAIKKVIDSHEHAKIQP